jgi:hypothetical protein
MKKPFTIFVLSVAFSALFLSCGGPVQQTAEVEKTGNDIFFERFKEMEGKKFAGHQVYIREDMESWADLELVMHVREYHHNVVLIPFRVGENTSRTWMLYREADGRLRFRHDHRHEDGSPEDLTLYGGYTAPGSDGFKQIFPADDYTCNMLQAICDNEWTVMFSEELAAFTYILKKAGELIFQADFDLTEAL